MRAAWRVLQPLFGGIGTRCHSAAVRFSGVFRGGWWGWRVSEDGGEGVCMNGGSVRLRVRG